MIEFIKFKNEIYPKIQAEGFASQFIFPFAEKFCKGIGLDIGCNKKEWALKGAIPVDIKFNDSYNAFNLPFKLLSNKSNNKKLKFDYIFSSHTLEHIPRWSDALEYWINNIESNGTLFLYLPDFSQKYWRPYNNKKHFHIFTPNIFNEIMNDYKDKFHWYRVSGVDLLNSFSVVAKIK